MHNAASTEKIQPKPADPSSQRSNSARLGIAALIAGLLALAVSILPALVLDRPLLGTPQQPAPDHALEPIAEHQDEPDVENEEGFTLKFKNFTLSMGKGAGDENEQPVAVEPDPEVAVAAPLRQDHDRWFRWLKVTSVGFALVGLLLGPIAWTRERHPAIAGSAMAISGAALLWQYIVMGIVIAVVIFVLLALFASIS